ncbi:putative F-box protein At5g55150 [Tasmannia lanceolata]|uniref:putative F-box protein At5g55150 n=1 Tax=Tasmannia lanceolata TaxID=3420 RepID=UPI004064869A
MGCGGLITPISLSPPFNSSKCTTSLPFLSFSPSIMPFGALPRLSLSNASNPIKTKAIHISSDIGEQSELAHWSVSQHRLPLLMLPDKERRESRKFFNLFENKLYDIQMPEFHGKWCCGSFKGWVVTVDDSSNIHLLNPLSKTQIQLPSLDKFTYPQDSFELEIPRDYRYIHNTVLSADPISTPDYIVVTIITNQRLFAYYKPGDVGWTTLDIPWGPYDDVIYYEGQFYCITNWGYVVACDFASDGLPKFTKVAKSVNGGFHKYIVESSGELLQVSRHSARRNMDPMTSCFEVFQLDRKTGKWIELESLGDQVLFLGFNCPFSLSALDFPQLKANCIYFTDDFPYKDGPGIDNGIYNLEDGSIKPYCPNSLSWNNYPIWIHPNL